MSNDFNFQAFLIEEPLYSSIEFNTLNPSIILNILFCINDNDSYNKFNVIKSYCPCCEKEAVFISKDTDTEVLNRIGLKARSISEGKSSIEYDLSELNDVGIFIREFICPYKQKDQAHNQIFVFRISENRIIKIGQWPSLAEISNIEIKKYRKFNNDLYVEFNRAIGLAAHGIGIGSFTYLRRIIEKYIVNQKLRELIEEHKITEDQVRNSDFKEKLKILNDASPAFLTSNSKIYSVLSKGIHDLSEDECRVIFPILKSAIEIILDEHIANIEKNKKEEFIKRELNKL